MRTLAWALVVVVVTACSGGQTGGTAGGSAAGGSGGRAGGSGGSGGTGGSGGAGGTGGSAGGTGGSGGSGGSAGGNGPVNVTVTGAVPMTLQVTPVAAYQTSSGKSGIQFNSPSSGRYTLLFFYTVTGRLMTGTFNPSTAGFTCGGDLVDTDGGTHWTMARANPDGGGYGNCQLQASSVTPFNISALGESYTVHGSATATMPDLVGDGGTVNISVAF